MDRQPGYRGYIGSRLYNGQRAPQHVQNLVIRDYCTRNGMLFLLSATEYAMPGCYMMLDRVLEECKTIEGTVLYSIFMLPEDFKKRNAVYNSVLITGSTLHAALEDISISSAASISRVEDLWRVQKTLQACPTSL